MERVLSWLNRPLFSGSDIRIWTVIAIGAVVIFAVIIVIILIQRKKSKNMKRIERTTEEPITECPKPLPALELANLQGIGSRSEQQDAFGISPMDRYEENGLLSVLCDGMGGMAEGALIATETVSNILGMFPWENDGDVPNIIANRSGEVYKQFRGHGGTTLVTTLIKGNELLFWCVGDSDLFLLREGKLYELNARHEYKSELILRAIDGEFPIEEAFYDSQSGALTEYIGKENAQCDYTRMPFMLNEEDTLLLCSDGVSDTLTLKQIKEAMSLSPQECCDRLEREILNAYKPNQDNYTAVIIRYHGKSKEE